MTFDTTEFGHRIGECEGEVARDPLHFLSFKTRRRMLLSLGNPASPLESLQGPMSPAHRIRAHLALQIAERALPFWSAHHDGDPGDVAVLMELARRVMVDATVDRGALFDEAMVLTNHLDGGAPRGRRGYDYVYAGYAVSFAASVIARDEQVLTPGAEKAVSITDVERPEDHHMFDCAAWAAAAEAGELPWGNAAPYDAARSRDYWHWYLREAIPRAVDAAG